MKKYLSLLMVLTLVMVLNIQTSLAKDEQEDSARIQLRTQMGSERSQVNAEANLRISSMRDEAKRKMANLREQIKQERDGARARIKETRINMRETALARFDAAVDRIENLKDRVNSHIDKLDAKGVNTDDAEDFVATAEIKLTAAKDNIVEINALFSVSINELSSEDRTKLRTLAKETQELLIEAHKALKDAIKSLKEEVRIKMEAEVD